MDVFTDPSDPFTQIHDHNPGVSASGLFWTMPVPGGAAEMRLDRGRAAFCLSDAQMPDMGDLLTALWGGGETAEDGTPLKPVFPSTVSVNARWFDAGPRERLRDDTENVFEYLHRKSDAQVHWRAIRRGASFESDNEPQSADFAAIGRERNGTFLNSDADDDGDD